MREINDKEKERIFPKLIKYIGKDNLEHLTKDGLILNHNQKIFYCKKDMYKNCSSIGRKELIGVGTLIGKLTKTNQFHVMITSLNILSPYALNKIWVKSSAEMNFLYGNDIQKAHVHKISENISVNSYAFVFNQNELCLGFGVCAKSSNNFSICEGKAVVLIHQSDSGEYLREQDVLF